MPRAWSIFAAAATYWIFVPLAAVVRPLGFMLFGAYLRVWRYPTISDVVQPDPSAKPVYDELYELYKGLYIANREDMHRIADLQERGSAGSR